MDHHWIIIIITASTISIKWCYLSILLVIGSSKKPTLFHARCRTSPLSGLHLQCQPFFMLDVGLVIFNTYIRSWEAQLSTMLERLCSYSRPWEAQPSTMLEMLFTYIRPWEAHPTTMSERLCTYIQPWEAHPTTISKRICTYIQPWES